MPKRHQSKNMEVLAGIEPAITELQSVALAPWLQNRYSNPLYQKTKALFQQSLIRFSQRNNNPVIDK